MVRSLLEACDEWGLLISAPKSYFGKRRAEYLGREVSAKGLAAHPKNLETLRDLPFPRSLKGMQSFLGSLNYYNKFIENFGVYAATLYKLTEGDFKQGMDALEKQHEVFERLKEKLVNTPLLKHFDPRKEIAIVVYTCEWAIAGSLLQEHDGVWMPVRFASCVLKDHEVRYDPVEKEVLAVLKVIDLCYSMVVGRSIRVITRHSILAWLFRSKGLQGRLQQWAALLSPWEIVVEKTRKGEDELCGLIVSSVTPARAADVMLESIRPRKSVRRLINATPFPSIGPGEEGYVISFDGSAKPKRSRGSYAAILWKLPEWSVIEAQTEFSPDATVNEAEYRGLILGVRLAKRHSLRRVIVCGDSRLIQQLRGEVECHSPGLKLL